jgi:hypothetical protein
VAVNANYTMSSHNNERRLTLNITPLLFLQDILLNITRYLLIVHPCLLVDRRVQSALVLLENVL